MLPKISLSKPHFRRRRSSAGSSKAEEDEPEIKHVDWVLDDHLPEEYFKQDIIQYAHELQIPGWSSVTQDMAEDLSVYRITGALTNAVYSVQAPTYVKDSIMREHEGRAYQHRLPQRLLLRVYGPQVDLLIDREKELETVALLTRNKIGPRLLGTFANGRFEQFLNAKSLLKEELMDPEVSRQIAKRMAELHTNIALTAEQRAAGPVVWSILDKWMVSAKERLGQLAARDPGCVEKLLQTTPDKFFDALKTYRSYIESIYPPSDISKMLVFCHNDTQYGNILRAIPPKGSPLLEPQNEHRKLVVIDFEYSGPNVPAYDIANHFCEWMGDYHHPTLPHKIWTERYPSKEQQMNFINAYVEHKAAVLDEAKLETEANDLYEQVKLWKPAVSFFWAIWGLVQTPIPSDNPIFSAREPLLCANAYEVISTSPPKASEVVEEVGDDFDTLGYTAEKINLFWTDFKGLGLQVD